MDSHLKSERGNILLKILLPIVFVLGATAFTVILIVLKPEPEKKELVRMLPGVEVMTLQVEPLSLTIESQGTIQPRTETVLTAEVSGVIEYVSPKLFAGSFFKKGDVLIEMDKVEYTAALANAKSMRATARLAYAQEESLSEQAQLDWKELGRGQPNDLVLRKPQLEKAASDIESAEAGVIVAERNLSKTTVRAPYDGRVHTKFVDVGQTVNARTTQLARIFAVDVAEVRLPISSEDVAFIDLPEVSQDGRSTSTDSNVFLSSQFGNKSWNWMGVIDRLEGVIDISTRQIYLVARVEDPYGQSINPDRPPLNVGQFVSAKISGKDLGPGFVIPRSALKPGNLVWIIDENDQLKITPVEVAKAEVNEAYITTGLKNGDRLCITQLGIVIDGMEVEVHEENSAKQMGSEL
ncbi:MAG: efflux RND transporter periplasmic adaptor subunit [Verrucomicrobia bacterium]|nr:efflux RND transporter periplasmic adaptor subunit [Verrucomicrobiota bacterium]MDA1068051.1 efflux RND transporter periplasmic adaptor subunit [Verrucomicrobiota bacterium]